MMPIMRNHTDITFIKIGVEKSIISIKLRDSFPQFSGTIPTPVTDVKRDDLSCRHIQSNPDPLLVIFGLHEAPHLISLNVNPMNYHAFYLAERYEIKMVWQRLIERVYKT
jgi:hypothetical protein